MGLSEEEKKRKQLLIDSIINQTYKPSKPKVETNQTERTQTLTDSIINHSYVQKKPRIREENTTKIRNNNNQENNDNKKRKIITNTILTKNIPQTSTDNVLTSILKKITKQDEKQVWEKKKANEELSPVFNEYGQKESSNILENKVLKAKENKAEKSFTETLLSQDFSKLNKVEPVEPTEDNIEKNTNILQDIGSLGKIMTNSASASSKQIANYILARTYQNPTMQNHYENIAVHNPNSNFTLEEKSRLKMGLDRLSGNKAIQNSIQQDNQKIEEELSKVSNPVAEQLGYVAQGLGQMAPGMVASAVNPYLGIVAFTTSAGGSYYDDAISRGMSNKDAFKYSTIMGALEGGTEVVITGKALNTLVKGVTGRTLSKEIIESFGMRTFEEFAQEAIMEPAQELTAQLTGGKEKADWSDMIGRMAQAGFTGALMGIIAGGSGAGLIKSVEVYDKVKNGQTVTQEEIKTAIEENIEKRGENVVKQEFQKGASETYNQVQNINNSVNNQEQTQLQLLQNDKIALQNELTNTTEPALQATLQQQIEQIDDQINEINNSNELANNDNVMYNNGNESVGGINDQVQQRRFLESTRQSQGIYEEETPFQSREFTKAEYKQWEKSVKPIDDRQLNTEQRTIKDNIKKQYNKDIVFFDGKDTNNGYAGGVSYDNTNKINIDIEQTKTYGINKMVYHEVLESDILKNKTLKQDIIEPTIQKIMDDPNFEQQRQEFWNNQEGNMPNDYLIAKDILCDRFAELKTGEQWDYKNVLSQETNSTMDLAIDNFYKEINNNTTVEQARINGEQFSTQEQQITPRENKIVQNKNTEAINNKEVETSTSFNLPKNNINELTDNGITMTYVRNANTSTGFYGDTFGQNLEPAGEYMNMDTLQGKNRVPGFEYGTITFNNPLILEHKNTGATGWKKDLSERYNGLTGKKLSEAIKSDGYDAIMTRDEDGNFIEVVNLNGKKATNQNDNSSKQNNVLFNTNKEELTYNDQPLYFRFDEKNGFRGKEHQSGVSMWEEQIDNLLYPDEDLGITDTDVNNLLSEYGTTQEEYDNMIYEEQLKIKREIALDRGLITQGASVFDLTNGGLEFFENYDRDHHETDYPVVNIFTGKENGYGADGENIVIPDTVVSTMSTKEFMEIIDDITFENDNLSKSELNNKILDAIANKINSTNVDFNIQENVKQPNKIEQKVNEYIEQVKDKFETDINIDTSVVTSEDNAPVDYKTAKEVAIRGKAKELFSKIHRRVFKNNNEKIYVNNTDISKSINRTLKIPNQKELIYENLAVFSKLDKVIENAQEIAIAPIDNKGRTQYSDYRYYVSNVNIDGEPYVVEFDTRVQEGTSGKQERHFRIERVFELNKEEVSATGTDNSINQFGTETSSINNSIPQTQSNMQVQEENSDIAPVKEDSSTPYRNIARANKLIKEKNSRIRQIESDMQQVTTPEAKNALQRQIDTIKEEYNNRIQKLYDGVNETSKEFTQEDYTNTVGENYTVDKSYEPKDGVYTNTSQYTPELYNNTLIEQTKQKAIKNSGLAQELTAPVREVQSENKSSLTDAWRQLRQFVTNKNASIDDLAKETGNKEIRYKGDRLNDISRSVSVDINVAQTDNNGHKIGKSLRELFDWARENDLYDDFNNYLIHQSNIERARHGKGLQNISEWQSKEIVKAYEETYPEFIERAQEVHQYSKNMLQNAVDAGRFTQELANLLSNNLYENYVPFFEVAGSLYNISPEEIKAGNPIKLAKGGADIQNISPIESSLEKQTYAYKSAILRNELYKEIVNTLQTVENTNNLQYIKNGTDNIAQSLLSDTDNFMQDRDGNKFLTAFVKGEPVTVQISQELYENLNRQVEDVVRVAEQKMSSFLKPLQTANTIYGKMLTTWSLTFPMANAIKDIQDATLNSKHTMDFIKYFTTGKTFSDIKNNSDAWQQFRLLYGTNVAEAQAGTGNIGRNIGSNNRFLNAVSSINELIELIPRYTEFKVSLDNGASITEALYNAKEVTTNFGRGGILTKALNRNGATFLNASVQGFSRFIRNFTEAYTEDGANGVAKMFVKAIMLGIAPAVLNHMLFGLGDDKDDEYQALPDYIKDNYYLIKYGDGAFIRIPKGRMLSVFGSSAIRTLETIEGKENAFDGWFTNAWTQSGANNPVEDNLFSGLLDTMRGETWYGTDLVPSRLEDELPKNQYDEKIDKFSIWLGEQFNISPYKINYLLQQYGGSIADIVLPMITPETKTANEDNPLGVLTSLFEDKFTANSTFDNRYAGEFYDLKDELTAIANDSQSTEKDKLKKLYLDDINSELGKLYEEKRNLQANESMTNSEKYSKVATIQAQINQIAYDALNNYEDVENYSNYATVSEKEYMLNTNDEGEKYWAKIKDELLEDMNSLGLQSTGKNEYLKTYTKVGDIYYNEELEYEAKRNKVTNIIINSKLSDDAKANMYNKHYSNEKTYNLISNINIDFNTYANSIIAIDQIKDQYANQDDMTSKQKTAQGKVRKKAVQQYINSLNLDIGQKLIMENILGGYSVNNSKTYLRQYIETLPLSKEEKQELDKKLFN